MENLSIYIHIPFCKRKCDYCAFTSFCAKPAQIDTYVDLLCKEIVSRKTNTPIKTIYIGGGTPSTLTACQIEKIIATLKENFNLQNLEEFTIEANPNSLTEELLQTYKNLGINRLSMGVQSLCDKSLKKIGRLHTAKMALQKISLAKRYITNISADLIIGLEKQTGRLLCRHAKKLLKAGVKHISCYLLEVYENTPLHKKIEENQYVPLTEEQTITAFNKLSKFLEKKKMTRYEISNFAYENFESKHNLNYWNRGEYLGFGISAHSFVDGKRLQNADNMKDYANGKVTEEKLLQKDIVEEVVMLGLRCNLGIDLSKLKKLGYDITNSSYFEEYLSKGILQLENNNILRLNPNFYHISNTIICNLLPD